MTIDPTLEQYFKTCGERLESALERALPSSTTPPVKLHQAMRYAALDGGKRIRPMLVYATAQALDYDQPDLDAPACAVELIHAYSLVHDDLPAMDNDELRRGKPTCHVAFDEATAILAGDALQSLAFQLLASAANPDQATHLEMLRILAAASGSRGMAGGQAMDIEAVGNSMNLPELENMHIHKTGALIRSSVQLGALAAGATTAQLGKLDHYAKCVGLAFQIQDDILDVEGETEVLGKTQGKDQVADKPTYPQLLGLDEAKEKAGALLEDALQALTPFEEKADQLRHIARFIVGRDR